ncbi:MAG: DUF3014 domain-containing protein [Gammaproteobacteria bacterium]
MDKKYLWPVLAAVLIGLIAVFYPRPAPEPPPAAIELPEQAPPPPPEPAFLDPDPEPEPAPDFIPEDPPEPLPPLPELDESDAETRVALAEVAGPELVERHLVSRALVRNLVATIDNLPREALWIQARVVPPIGGPFLVEGAEDAPVIATSNFDRYTPFVQLVEAVDTDALAQRYQQYYPLLQQAYEELGYPGRQFHNQALEIIAHLLATPRVDEPIRLTRPHVLYKYADPQLEALSSGQKILLRIGPANAAVIRAKLIELRAALEDLSAAPRAE